MKKIIDTKKILFENMAKLNSDFQAPKELLSEGKKSAKKEAKKEALAETDKWIHKAVNPEHKGYCSPMSKSTCTPRRKALAKRFKKGIDENGMETEQELSTEEKYEELVGLIDDMYSIIHGEEEPEEEPMPEPEPEPTVEPEDEIEPEAETEL